MYRSFIVTIAAACLPVLPAMAQDQLHSGDVREGSRLFSIHCAACHGPEGTGDGTVRTRPSPADLTDPSRMNLLSDTQLLELIRKGGPVLGRRDAMPGFEEGISNLELWGLASFLRTRHLSITDFFPFAANYWGESYTIDEWGLERYEQIVGEPLPEDERSYVVLGIYRGTPGPEGPALIPDDPREIAKIKREDKVGYIAFVPMEIPGISGEQVLGISMDNNGIVYDIMANTQDEDLARRVQDVLFDYIGEGRKGMRQPFTARGPAAELAASWTETYHRAMEAVVMFDKAERDRHWADSAFGRGEDAAISVEGGELDVDQ